MEQSFIQKYGPWGVVTGGTRGIGKALAESLASRGLNVVIIGTRNVNEVAEELADRFKIQTKAIQADLGDPSQIDRIKSLVKMPCLIALAATISLPSIVIGPVEALAFCRFVRSCFSEVISSSIFCCDYFSSLAPRLPSFSYLV